ncbi:MAG TPA: dihydrodipicolinate synthase family protein [Candidatus Latescibacteria bacterium]|nr:dihydrodipicolinate synthase family protein [Candidatus Handelsmanbacteria bacterium]HIL09136.1 dihydrodipicolinate synthase family protein [Candidatus Latescibacterota bacterium]
MPIDPMRGVFPILITPFDVQDRIDKDSLQNLVDYCIEAGVHGFGIAYATEIPKLTEAERLQVAQIVIERSAGRVPVVMTTGSPATTVAVEYSRQAADLGADAVMSLPPTGATAKQHRAYFKAISDAVDIPIFLLEAGDAIGGPLMRQIAEESQQLRYAKVESAPAPHKVGEAVTHGAGLVTVMGGASGTHLIEELRRGSEGTMPWPSLPHAFVKTWNQWQAGDQESAQQTWQREILPVIRIGGLVHKEILYRQGVIATPRFRDPTPALPLDETTQREFDRVCERLGIGQFLV